MDMDMDLEIDRPSALLAVAVGLAASLVVDAGTGTEPVQTQQAPASKAAVSGPTTRAGCPLAAARRGTAVPPAGPPDRQINSLGTNAAGAGGTVSAQVLGDPCERPNLLLQRRSLAPRGTASAPAR